MSFILAAVMTLAAAGDVRILRSGMPRGRPRLARHLWRIRGRRTLPVLVRHDPMPLTPPAE